MQLCLVQLQHPLLVLFSLFIPLSLSLSLYKSKPYSLSLTNNTHLISISISLSLFSPFQSIPSDKFLSSALNHIHFSVLLCFSHIPCFSLLSLSHTNQISKIIMSSTSSRRSSRTSSRNHNTISDDQIIDLVSKLQQLLPELHNRSSRRNSDKVSASRVLQETCNYIKSLHREVDGLSERLSLLLETTDHTNTAQAAIIRSLLL